MNDRQQRNSTGLSAEEFDKMAEFLKPYASLYVAVDYKEALNILMTHIR